MRDQDRIDDCRSRGDVVGARGARETNPRSDRGQVAIDLLLCVLIVIIPLIAYWPVLRSGFVSDDFVWHQFFRNSPAEIIEKIRWQRAGLVELAYFRPTVVAGYQLDYRLWGDSAFAFHLTNVILHSLNAALLYLLARAVGMSRFGATAAGIFFAIYPANSEAVTWISARADELALLFLLAGLLAWSAARLRADHRWIGLSALMFLIAVGAKESAAAGILILPLIDWLLRRRVAVEQERVLRPCWTGYLVYLAIVAAVIAFRFWMFGDIGGMRGPGDTAAYLETDLPQVWSALVLHDLWVMVTPVSRILWPDWPYAWRIAALATGAVLAVALLIGTLAAMLTSGRERASLRFIVVGILWIIIMLLPLIPLQPASILLARSRYLYASSAGLALWIGGVAGLSFRGGMIAKTASIVMLAAIVALSTFAIRDYGKLWLQSGEIAGEMHRVMATNTSHLADDANLYVVNFPWRVKGVPCAPFRYGEYLEFLYGFKRVHTHRVRRSGRQVLPWWLGVRDSAEGPVAGFVWDGAGGQLLVLPQPQADPIPAESAR